jgi:hypothetical protein
LGSFRGCITHQSRVCKAQKFFTASGCF